MTAGLRHHAVQRESVAKPQRAHHRSADTEPILAGIARPQVVQRDLAGVARVRLRYDHQGGSARKTTGLDLETSTPAEQIIENKNEAFDVAHLDDGTRLDRRQVRLNDALANQTLGIPLKCDLVKTPLHDRNFDDPVFRRLFRKVGVAKVIAEFALQILGGGSGCV